MKQWLRQGFANAMVVVTVLAMTAVPVGLLVFHVWNQFRIAEVGYEIAEATSEHQELLEENKKLVVEARLQGRSDRVAEMAREQFGLEQARPEQIVRIERGEEPTIEEHAHLDATDEEEQRPVVQ